MPRAPRAASPPRAHLLPVPLLLGHTGRYARFPYDIPAAGGWHDETPDCSAPGVVNRSAGADPYAADWATVRSSTTWIEARARARLGSATGGTPWFAYSGMLIVHPPCARLALLGLAAYRAASLRI